MTTPTPSDRPEDYASGMASTMQLLLGIANQAPTNRAALNRSIPLTVVAGFLGAGKTTLLNAILAEPGGRRVAVIVNDFGSVEVDAALVRERSGSAISLSNGCVCCSLAGGLAATLAMLVQHTAPPDAIVLETSGIAEPDSIVHAALQQPEIRLNAIVGVLDCERTPGLLQEQALRRLLEAQIGRADIVLLNKVEIAADGAIAETERWVKAVAHLQVRLVRTTHSRLPADIVLGEPKRRSFLLADAGINQHGNMFESCTVEHDGALDPRRLADLAGALPDGVLRAKGIVLLHGTPLRSVAVQVAGRRWSFTDISWPSDDRSNLSRMIAIGRRGAVDQGALQAAFTGCGVPKA